MTLENLPAIQPPSDEKIKELMKKQNLIIFTCTYYPDIHDLRLRQCLRTLQDPNYGAASIPIVVVDGSPPEVHALLKTTTGAIVCEEKKTYGKGKGGALREAAMAASSLPGTTDSTWLCWQEPEKTDMNRCWVEEVLRKSQSSDDVICPAREDTCFRTSYPIEQYHSESCGNHYLNCVMKGELKESENSRHAVDWFFGPFAFRRNRLNLWMEYKGTSYDAQLIPMVAAIRKGYQVNSSIEVTFRLDAMMKQQEEGDLKFIEKRLMQLNNLSPKVMQSWKDSLYC